MHLPVRSPPPQRPSKEEKKRKFHLLLSRRCSLRGPDNCFRLDTHAFAYEGNLENPTLFSRAIGHLWRETHHPSPVKARSHAAAILPAIPITSNHQTTLKSSASSTKRESAGMAAQVCIMVCVERITLRGYAKPSLHKIIGPSRFLEVHRSRLRVGSQAAAELTLRWSAESLPELARSST